VNTASQNASGGETFAIFAQGFRPFFFGAAIWAVIAIGIWVDMLLTGAALPSRFDPLAWHIHEMLFGFVMAAVAGFLLTAIPNWTKRLPISGAPLAALAGLWLAGRIVCLISLMMPAWLAIAADLAFPIVLATAAGREIIAGKNWRNLVMLVPVTLLGISNLLMHLETDGVAIAAGLGWRLGLVAVIALISLIGGRIIPNFTRNWLMKHDASALPAQAGWPDKAALGTLQVGLLGWAILPKSSAVACIVLLGAALNLWRLYRWRGISTAKEPLLFVLHIGYGWTIIGTALLGLSVLTPRVPEGAAIHALTVGAIGTMILAVMSRATRGHTGRPLTSDASTRLMYILVTLGAIVRISAEFSAEWAMSLLLISAGLWSAAFAIFVLSYASMLLWSRDDIQ
jgi:uncharacterized protein involved in response to NO